MILRRYSHLKKKFNFKKIFYPEQTSLEVVKASEKYLKKNQSILDLGCGGGIICGSLYKKTFNQKLYLSDIDKRSIRLSKKNLSFIKKNIFFKNGDSFEPWIGQKFDIIINDISGVSSKIAKLSPWFKNVPADKSSDGISLLKNVLNNCKHHMKQNSYLFFPIISLSNVEEAKKILKKNLKIIKISKIEWPLPSSMYKNYNILNSLKRKKKVDFKEKYNMIICYTLIITSKLK
jgi:methylase of polypeptide subunit release factors